MLACLATLFPTENRSSDFVLVSLQLFTTTKKARSLDFSLLPLTSLCLGRGQGMWYAVRGCAGLWSSSCRLSDNKPPDALPAVPQVGYGETARAANTPTLKQEKRLPTPSSVCQR